MKSIHCPDCTEDVPLESLLDHASDIHVGSSSAWGCGSCNFRSEEMGGVVRHSFAMAHPVTGIFWDQPPALIKFLQRMQDTPGSVEEGRSAESPSSVLGQLQLNGDENTIASRFGKIKSRAKGSLARWTPIHHRNMNRRKSYSPRRVQEELEMEAAANQVAATDEEHQASFLDTSTFNPARVKKPAEEEAEDEPAAIPDLATPSSFTRNTTELRETCSRCGRTVKLRNERGVICRGMAVSHLKACLDIRPWACTFCDKLFADKFPVTKHAAKHHGDGSETCLRMVLEDKAGVEARLINEMTKIFPSVPMDGWRGIE